MGNCLVSIHVTGCHHNGLRDDIERMAARFVGELREAGHDVGHATVVAGGVTDVSSERSLLPLREAD